MDADVRERDEWGSLSRFLPSDLDELAFRTGALRRRRALRSGADLVRLALVYSLDDMSLRETSAWARERGIAKMSDVAVLKRLRGTAPFLRALCAHLLSCAGAPGSLRLVVEDATVVCRKRAAGPDFRVHVAYSPSGGVFLGMEATRADAGERLDRLPCGPGDVLVGDIAYQARVGLARVRERGAHALVRFYPSSLPLESLDGERLDAWGLAAGLEPEGVLDLSARTVPRKDAPPVEGRVVVARKPDAKAEEGLARKARAKGSALSEEAERSERCVWLFTTLPRGVATPEAILEIYRVRWQVEMAFKRSKGVVSLGETRARDMDLCECKVLAKLLTLLLIQACEGAFPPLGSDGAGRGTAPTEPLRICSAGSGSRSRDRDGCTGLPAATRAPTDLASA